MTDALRRRLHRLENQRADLLAGIARLSPAELERRPSADAWSIAQVIDHLAASEEAMLEMGQRVRRQGTAAYAPAVPEPGTGGLVRRMRTWYRRRLVFTVLATGIRVRMPRRIRELVGLPEPVSAAAAVARWESARAGLAEYLGAAGRADERRPFFHHPITGWLDHRQGLDFIRAHIAHHERQIGRIRRANGY